MQQKPYSTAVAEALGDEGLTQPIRWAQLIELVLLRFSKDPVLAAGTFAREWHLVSAFDEFVAELAVYEGPDRAEKIEAAFDEHLAEYRIEKPF